MEQIINERLDKAHTACNEALKIIDTMIPEAPRARAVKYSEANAAPDTFEWTWELLCTVKCELLNMDTCLHARDTSRFHAPFSRTGSLIRAPRRISLSMPCGRRHIIINGCGRTTSAHSA